MLFVYTCRRRSLIESQVNWRTASRRRLIDSHTWIVCMVKSRMKVWGEPWRRAHTFTSALLHHHPAGSPAPAWWRASEVRNDQSHLDSLQMFSCGWIHTLSSVYPCFLAGVRLKSCKTQTSLTPPLSLSPGHPQHDHVFSSSHRTSHDPGHHTMTFTDSSPVAMAIPLGR